MSKELSLQSHWWVTTALMLGLTTAGLNVTSVSLAYPKMITSLRTGLDHGIGHL